MDAQYAKQNESTAARRRFYFVAVSSSNLQTRQTGLTNASFTKRWAKNGTDAAGAGTVVEVSAANQPGIYYYEATTGEVDTLGKCTLRLAYTGMETREICIVVGGPDAWDGVRFGQTALPNAAAQGAGGLLTSGTGAHQMNVDGAGFVYSDARKWLGGAIPAPTVTGVPKTDNTHWLGGALVAVNTTGIPLVDVTYWRGTQPNVLQSGRVDSYTGSMAANVITATAINAAAITAAKFATDAIDANSFAAATATEIANSVDSVLTAAHDAGSWGGAGGGTSAVQAFAVAEDFTAEVPFFLADRGVIAIADLTVSILPPGYAAPVFPAFVFGTKATVALVADTKTLNLAWAWGTAEANGWDVNLVAGAVTGVVITVDVPNQTVNLTYQNGVATSDNVATAIGNSAAWPHGIPLFTVASSSGVSAVLNSPTDDELVTFSGGTNGTLDYAIPTNDGGIWLLVTIASTYTGTSGTGFVEVLDEVTSTVDRATFRVAPATLVDENSLTDEAAEKIADAVAAMPIENAYTLAQLQRLATSVLAGGVQDFTTGTLVFKSLDGSKTRLTVTTDSTGRLSTVVGDLS